MGVDMLDRGVMLPLASTIVAKSVNVPEILFFMFFHLRAEYRAYSCFLMISPLALLASSPYSSPGTSNHRPLELIGEPIGVLIDPKTTKHTTALSRAVTVQSSHTLQHF